MEKEQRPIVFTKHARERMRERGAREEDIRQAIWIGRREPARHGHSLYCLNLEFNQEWDGRFYKIQQVAPVVAEERDRFVVITVYTFYFQEIHK